MTIESAQLSHEDSLRLNVLMANAEAVRIDENRMQVCGLCAGREMKVELNPTCGNDRYLRSVRALISEIVLGHPEGYPLYISTWTRTGQLSSDAKLEDLLRLGEPEAVLALARNTRLNHTLAEQAWWAESSSEIARFMLLNDDVVQGSVGQILAQHLVEHLPFETGPEDMIETVRLVLKSGLINVETQERLWLQSGHKQAYRIGFLQQQPDALPLQLPPRIDLEENREMLLQAESRINGLLLRLLDAPGQTYLQAVSDVLRSPGSQVVASELLNCIGSYCGHLGVECGERPDLDAIHAAVREWCGWSGLSEALRGYEAEIMALLFLSCLNESLLYPIFARTTASGSLLRKKLEPVSSIIQDQIRVLQG